jgi:hypothetical protein
MPVKCNIGAAVRRETRLSFVPADHSGAFAAGIVFNFPHLGVVSTLVWRQRQVARK